MTNYLNTLISEKGLNLETIIEVQGESGTNFIPLAVVVEHIAIANSTEQAQIKNTLVKIDFHNGDVMHFFNHLAQAIAR
jgi:folate-dependent phosphoribosylglycinamide formyltransferase PurN